MAKLKDEQDTEDDFTARLVMREAALDFARQQLVRLSHELSLMYANKPNDRSKLADRWEIAIIEFEKFLAYLTVYIADGGAPRR
jgi:hypothetical protein